MKRIPKAIVQERPLKRRSASREVIPSIYIVLEGEITEPFYIHEYHNCLDKKGKVIILGMDKGAGTPLTIVRKCIDKKRELRKNFDLSSTSSKDAIWAVFDTDEHPYLDDAIRLARENNIYVAISNPCIEVWGVMHDRVYDQPMTRHEAQDALSQIMPNYHHEKSPKFDWQWCKGRLDQAHRNSNKAIERRQQEGTVFPKTNPTTNFHELLLALEIDGSESKKERLKDQLKTINVT